MFGWHDKIEPLLSDYVTNTWDLAWLVRRPFELPVGQWNDSMKLWEQLINTHCVDVDEACRIELANHYVGGATDGWIRVRALPRYVEYRIAARTRFGGMRDLKRRSTGSTYVS